MREKAKKRLSFAATGAVIEAQPQHTYEAARQVSGVEVQHAWRHLDGYDASDSEHEQLDWRGQLGDVGRYTGEESESESSGGDTDDDCISERVADFEARRDREARRERGPRERRSMRVTRKGARPLGEVQRLWDAGMTSSSHQGSDDDRESLTSTTDMMARRAEGASADTSRRSRGTTPGEVATDDTFATRLAGRAVRFGSEEDAGTDQPDDRRQRPTGERWDRKSRVARVADFARWTEAIAATADDTASKTKRSRKRAVRAERRWAAAAVSDITGARERVSREDDDDDDGDVGGVTRGGAEHNPFAKTVRHARSQGSGYRARGAESFGTEDAAAGRAVKSSLLRCSEDRPLITAPPPLPVTSRFGAPIPVTKWDAIRMYKSAQESAVSCRRGTELRRRPTSRRGSVKRLLQPAQRGGSARHGPVACRGLRTSPLGRRR